MSTTHIVGTSNVIILFLSTISTISRTEGQGRQRNLSPISILKNNYYTFKEHKESCLYLRKFAPSKKFRNNKLYPILAEKGNELKGFFSAFT